jgi:hypothetical protein
LASFTPTTTSGQPSSLSGDDRALGIARHYQTALGERHD